MSSVRAFCRPENGAGAASHPWRGNIKVKNRTFPVETNEIQIPELRDRRLDCQELAKDWIDLAPNVISDVRGRCAGADE